MFSINKLKLTKLIFWLVIFESIGFLIGMLAQANIDPWYTQLNKSSLTPPGFVFSIVWTCLYALLAVVAWTLSDIHLAYSKQVKLIFTVQTLMNWAWTPIFFSMHWLMPSAIWLLILTLLNLLLIIKLQCQNKNMALLLIPYLIWLVFASYLNFVIALMN